MIDSLTMMLFMRHGKNEIFAYGNHQLDRNVFFYLIDTIDLNTGIAGSKHKLSNGRIADDISERRVQGSRAKPILFNTSGVRNAIGRLVDAGLFDRMSEKGKGNNLLLRACTELVKAPMAHNSVQKKVTHKLPTTPQAKSVTNQGTYGNEEHEGYAEVTINKSFHPSFPQTADDLSTKFQMDIAWQPRESFITEIVNDFNPTADMKEKLRAVKMGFKVYWSTTSTSLNQAEWENKLWKNEIEPLLVHGKLKVSSPRGNPALNAPTRQTARRAAVSPKRSAKLLVVPEKYFGRVLEQWAINNADFRRFAPGEEDIDYKRALKNHIYKLNTAEEKKSFKGTE